MRLIVLTAFLLFTIQVVAESLKRWHFLQEKDESSIMETEKQA